MAWPAWPGHNNVGLNLRVSTYKLTLGMSLSLSEPQFPFNGAMFNTYLQEKWKWTMRNYIVKIKKKKKLHPGDVLSVQALAPGCLGLNLSSISS